MEGKKEKKNRCFHTMFGNDTVCSADGTDGIISIGSLSWPEGLLLSISCMRSKRDDIWLAYKL